MAAPSQSILPLSRLAAATLTANWGSLSAHTQALSRLPPELVKLVWKEIRAHAKRLERPVLCKEMYPLVRSCWRVETLDLSDASRWLTDASLLAIACIPGLRHLRLTACSFLTDAGLAAFADKLCAQQPQPVLASLDVSWCEVADAAVAACATRLAPSLTSLNLTGLRRLTDQCIASVIACSRLELLSLACTSVGDVGLDYLTYYSRVPPEQHGAAFAQAQLGCHALRRLELSSTALTDTGVLKLIATVEKGTPYGKVFKQLEYLALSSTPQVTPAAVRQVRTRYALDAPLPNAQRTLASSNAVALDAQPWVLRLPPDPTRSLPPPSRAWEGERLVAYVAQYTKEMAASVEVIERLTAADHGGPPMTDVEAPVSAAPPEAKRPRAS